MNKLGFSKKVCVQIYGQNDMEKYLKNESTIFYPKKVQS